MGTFPLFDTFATSRAAAAGGAANVSFRAASAIAYLPARFALDIGLRGAGVESGAHCSTLNDGFTVVARHSCCRGRGEEDREPNN